MEDFTEEVKQNAEIWERIKNGKCDYKGCTFGEGNHVHLPCDENCDHETLKEFSTRGFLLFHTQIGGKAKLKKNLEFIKKQQELFEKKFNQKVTWLEYVKNNLKHLSP